MDSLAWMMAGVRTTAHGKNQHVPRCHAVPWTVIYYLYELLNGNIRIMKSRMVIWGGYIERMGIL
jgi:hypothetical protein